MSDPEQEEGPARVTARSGAECSSKREDTSARSAAEPTCSRQTTRVATDFRTRVRDPLFPRVGALLDGDARDGVLLRWARNLPPTQRLRVSFDVVASGTVVSEVDFAMVELAAALGEDADERVDLARLQPRLADVSHRTVRRALGLLLVASDRTVCVSGILPRYFLARPGSPCPICRAVGARPGVPRECIVSSIGTVVCRGEPNNEILASGRHPFADVVGCKCPAKLWLVGEPAASSLVLPATEAHP